MQGGDVMAETYTDPCPVCGDRLLGVSKAEFVEHLRSNDEQLAADIHEKLVYD
jgi:transcription initiation factor IIE alpha subunit